MTTLGQLFMLAAHVKHLGHSISFTAHSTTHLRNLRPATRQSNIRIYRAMLPVYEDAAFVAPTAMIQGNVVLGENTSIMYSTVIRNYNTGIPVRVGDNTALLDRVTLMGQVRIGHDTIIGPGCVLDCCDVHDNCYVGAQASVSLGCIIEDGAIVAPGTTLLKDTRVAAGTFWAGNPGVCIGAVTPEQAAEVQHLVHDSLETAKAHRKAIESLHDEVRTLNYDWLMKCCEKIESRNKALKPAYLSNIPLEAKRFIEPRVQFRRPTTHYGVGYPVNKIAPWVVQMHALAQGNV